MAAPDIIAAVEKFAADWQQFRHNILRRKWTEHKIESVTINYGAVFAKLIVNEAACAFVALVDGENKKLGAFQAGDIFKEDSWSSPAKHKRGSVFDADPLRCMTAYGVQNLR